ncbi:hypothetical protein FNF27_08197 [Cafeteria roenbergensis]|uniref:CCHC-type domain-containing protein n=1 Tax=Cafeteria roenbergensis TaxID=33653 RepID=A0A5A8DAQ3_CAFRO|nr:hypothetical protein FNF27_08197 [Cafeteria roenbergensis]
MATPMKSMFRTSVPGGSIALHRAKPVPETPVGKSASDSRAAPAALPEAAAAFEPQLEYHKSVGYDSSSRSADSITLAASEAIARHYSIPPDFEVDKVTYGPLSGQSHASRVVAAYERGVLPLRPGSSDVQVCSACGAEGHRARRCPATL